MAGSFILGVVRHSLCSSSGRWEPLGPFAMAVSLPLASGPVHGSFVFMLLKLMLVALNGLGVGGPSLERI